MVCVAGLQEARLQRRIGLVHENVGDVGERGLEIWGSNGEGGMGMIIRCTAMDFLELLN